jgi:hypothetical protein
MDVIHCHMAIFRASPTANHHFHIDHYGSAVALHRVVGPGYRLSVLIKHLNGKVAFGDGSG